MEMSPSLSGRTCTSCGAPFAPAVAGQTTCDRCQGLLPAEPRTSPLQGSVVDGYRLVHELGAGRFSSSWLAEDQRGTSVVVKLLRSFAPDLPSAQVFLAEAHRLAASQHLDHPNVAHLLSGGVYIVSALFLVYEHGGEHTLVDELRSHGRLWPGRALELCAQLAEALEATHAAGVLHLDLKPANVGLTRLADGTEQAVLLDVATAHLLARSGLPPAQPLPPSSAAYLSPEEAAAGALDGRADFYSLGVLLYQLLSGQLPFTGASSDELLRAHLREPARSLRNAGLQVDGEIEALLAGLLSKDPAHRPAHGDELAVMLRALVPLAEGAHLTEPLDALAESHPRSALFRADDARDSLAGPPFGPAIEATLGATPPAGQVHATFDPELERALLGMVPPQASEPPPGIPNWTRRAPPAFW
ncbi:MAG: hypothetical protein NVS2B9_13030 [Myxococcales bacterium]